MKVPGMRLLDRLLLSEVLRVFLFSVALFTTILVAMTELQPLTSMAVERHVAVETVGRIFLLSLPKFVALAFPMAMLLSTLLAFGTLSADSEIIALQAAGVSLYRMAIPVSLLGILVSFIAIIFNEEVVPLATDQQNRIYDAAVQAGVPANRPFHYEQIRDGHRIFSLDADNYDSQTKRMTRPTFLFFNPNGEPRAILWAPSGRWDGGTSWKLTGAAMMPISRDPDANTTVVQAPEWTTETGVSLDQLLMANQDPDAMTYHQLANRIRRKERQGDVAGDINPDRVKLYSKIAIPFASLVFALVGFPLGIRRQRSGGAIGFALSIGIIFVYYLIYTYASILGNNGAVSPIVSAWIADAIGLGAAIALVRNVSG